MACQVDRPKWTTLSERPSLIPSARERSRPPQKVMTERRTRGVELMPRESERARARERESAREREKERERKSERERARERERERERARARERERESGWGRFTTPRFPPTSPQSGIKSPFSGLEFEVALAGTRRLVVQIKAMEKHDVAPLGGLVASLTLYREREVPAHSKVDDLGWRYKSVNFGAKTNPGPPN